MALGIFGTPEWNEECRLYQIAPISTNMVLAYVAQHVLGLPRSY